MATPLAPGFRFSGQTQHRLSYEQVKRLAQAFGLPGDAMAQIAKGESGLNADVQQRDPGDGMVGYGLLQMTPNAWGKGSAAYKHMQSLGGVEAMRDPVKNMAMARFLYKSAGNKLTPWYGTRFLTNRSGEGSLGPVDRSKADVGSAAPSGATTRIPGQTITSQIPTVDKAGFEQARKLAIVGGLIARRNPNSFLLRSGLLSTQEPALSNFVGSRTVKDVIPGATVRTPAGDGQIVSGSARTPVGRKAKVIGVPYQGTHTLGNWQSDNAVDISVPVGTPMVSLQDGVVVKVRHHPQNGGRFAGDQITVRGANGNEYFYAHGVAHVQPGQRIRRGQKLGTTGSANGVAHLHFGQMKGDPRRHT